MAKRFIDTSIFRKPLLRGMQAPYKALFIYLLCECDHAGVWDVELGVASDRLGMTVTKDSLKEMGGAVVEIDGGDKWHLVNFVEFQYGTLNRSNRVHLSVIDRLAKLGIDPSSDTPAPAALPSGRNKGLIRPLQGSKDKDKDKDTGESVREPSKRKAAAEPETLCSESGLTVSEIEAKLPDLVAEGVDLAAYLESVELWSERQKPGENLRTKRGWIATVRQFIARDRRANELILKPSAKAQATAPQAHKPAINLAYFHPSQYTLQPDGTPYFPPGSINWRERDETGKPLEKAQSAAQDPRSGGEQGVDPRQLSIVDQGA